MSQKVLQQFAAKISRAKHLYQTTKNQCENLKKEASKLQKEYEQLVNQRKAAQKMQQNLKNEYLSIKKQNQEESLKCSKQTDQLNNLRSYIFIRILKKKLKREKDVCEAQLLKNTLNLQELVKERQNLQSTAKQMSQKLENITIQKTALQQQFQRTNNAIQNYNIRIKQLKNQMDTMKGLISNSCQ